MRSAAARKSSLTLASGSEKGIQSVVFYLAIYMVMMLGVFAIVLMMKRKGIMVETVPDLAGLGRLSGRDAETKKAANNVNRKKTP